jgi:hypothetical protein
MSSKSTKSSKDVPTSNPSTRAFLLSARNRNATGQFTGSQSSSSSVRSSESQPAQPSPIIAPTVVALPELSASTVQQSPRLSPEKVREAIDQVRHELSQSPPFARSASASPTSVRSSPNNRPTGESTRLSTSPGAPSPSPVELMSFMTNISSMLREQQTTTHLLLQRVVDIESANARQRGKREPIKQTLSHSNVKAVDRASNQSEASEGASIPISRVLLEPDRITHDDPEDLKRQETGDATDVSDDDDEEKYQSVGIPADKSELKIIRQEQQHPEEEIMLPIDEDDSLDDYVAWLLRRQKLYPFEDKKYQKLYVPRHTLLSPNGRLREYSRFGFLTSWDIRLYGDLANRWFRRLLHDNGIAREADKKPRSASIHHVRVPMMSYDTRDRLSTVRTGEENELPFNSFTLSGLPLLLRGEPGLALARAHSLSLQEEADIYVNQRKRSMVAKGQINIDSESEDDDDSSTTSSIASNEVRTCSKCERPVYGLNNLCSIHAQKAGRHVSSAEYQAALQRRRERASKSSVSDKVAPNIQVKTEAAPPTSAPTFTQHSPPDSVQSTVTLSSFGAPELKSESMPSLIEEDPISYPAQRLKQESTIRLNRLQKEEQERISGLTNIDRIEESASVLGSILSRAFTPAVRATLRTGKLAVGTRLSGKDRIAAVEEMKKNGVTFSGDRMKAPAYLKKLCATVLKWDLNAGEVYQVMDSTMDKQAATWLQDTWALTGELPAGVKPVEALLDSFMRLWMDQATKRMFRESLKSLRMPTETATLDELNTHYSKFSEYLNGLRMCDKNVDMQDIIHEYFETLPNRVQAFIGTRYMSAISIAEVHAEAETALRTMHIRRTPKQDGDLGEVVGVNTVTASVTESIPVNAMPTKPRSRQKDRTSQSTYEKLDKRDVVCWHCGDKGHYAGVECPHIDQPQTRRGQAAWAEYQKKAYTPRAYDKNYYIARSRQASSPSRNADSSPVSTISRSKTDRQASTASSSDVVKKKNVSFQSQKKRADGGGRLKKVSGAPLSKTADSELDDEEEESEEA